jgi:two-component system, cell cycle sensor histidine kinase and response regulator CckA
VKSEPGKGSTFELYFPLVAESPETIQPAALEPLGSRSAGVVLLVEDEPAVRSLARSVLESGGYMVLEAGDPAEALRRFGKLRPGERFDLLLTDVVMPQMSGIALADQLLKVHREMKVVYMSGYSDELLQQQGIRPSSAFIAKPFTRAALLAKVREALNDRTVRQG